MGRPKANIDWKRVDHLLTCQCDGVGIAGILGVSPDTLYRACQEEHNIGFAEYSAQKKSEGKELLRAKQFENAMNGDKTMQIWLGKQYLGQKDKNDITTDDKPITPTEFVVEVLDGKGKV
jgi:hypothetical protein